MDYREQEQDQTAGPAGPGQPATRRPIITLPDGTPLTQAIDDERRIPRNSAVRRGRCVSLKPHQRSKWFQRPVVMLPLLGLFVLLLTLGTLWWYSPVIDPLTGVQTTRGEGVLSTIGVLANPEVSLATAFPATDEFSVLVIGLDHVPPTPGDPGLIRRADSLMLASASLETKQLRVVSLPRDGWAKHWQNGRDFGYEKLAHTFSLGQQRYINQGGDGHIFTGGIQRTTESVEKLIDLPVDYYLIVEFEGLVELVDALGGLTVDVEKALNYDDNAGDLHIHLAKGEQLLNGEQVMGYARFRHDALGDIARMGRQQKVLHILVDKLKQERNLATLVEIAEIAHDSVHTNLSLDQLIALAQHIDEFGPESLKTQTLPSYWNREPGHEIQLRGVPEGKSVDGQYIKQSDRNAAREFLNDLAPPPPPPPPEPEPE